MSEVYFIYFLNKDFWKIEYLSVRVGLKEVGGRGEALVKSACSS